MEFDNILEVPLPPEEAWKVLLDVRRVVACIPGAELTEVVDERTYKGKVALRIGPVALAFVGQAKLEEVDEARYRAQLRTQGSDSKGRGGSDSVIEFTLEPAGAGTKVAIHSNVKLSGAIAQYGRGSGMIQNVAAQLITQFGDALKAQIAQSQVGIDTGSSSVKPISGLSVLRKAAWDTMTDTGKKSPTES
jgi:uncharacterized protein